MNKKGNPKNLTNAGKGRPKGCKNKYSSDVKQMVLDALNERGGKDFFRKLDNNTFARVSAKLVPQVIDANVSGEMTQVVKIISNGEGKKGGGNNST